MNVWSGGPFLLAVLLVLGVLLAWARLAWWQARAPRTARSARWRMLALFALQPLCAVLLYFTLLPPRQAAPAGTLVVMTARSADLPLPAALQGQPRIALPEAGNVPGVERAPDLATALRRHPDAPRLHVVGAGLEARDADAATGHALAFTPAPLPRGVVRLSSVPTVATGASFVVAGRIEGVPQAMVELHDPAGKRIDSVAADADGAFVLHGLSRLPGPARFAVQVRGTDKRLIETIGVPVWTQAASPPRVWVLAGAPNAELKYLRRWAADTGIPLHMQVSMGGGLQLGDPPLPMAADTLKRFDLVVLDERSATTLSDGQRAALMAAVRDGLGVLVRAGGPLTASAQRWLGMAATGGQDEAPFRLPPPAPDDDAWRARRGVGSTDAPIDAEAVTAGLPALTRRTLTVGARDALPLLRDTDGHPVAYWRNQGRGRIGLWLPQDTYALVLAGHPDVHAALWSQAFGTLARPSGARPPRLPDDARERQRAAFCSLTGNTRVVAPDGRTASLSVDPITGGTRCAAYWPRVAGWHRLETPGGDWPFHVRAHDEAPGLLAAAQRERTARLVGESDTPAARAMHEDGPRGSAWPWFLGWLLATGLLWWLERSRRGRPAATG